MYLLFLCIFKGNTTHFHNISLFGLQSDVTDHHPEFQSSSSRLREAFFKLFLWYINDINILGSDTNYLRQFSCILNHIIENVPAVAPNGVEDREGLVAREREPVMGARI